MTVQRVAVAVRSTDDRRARALATAAADLAAPSRATVEVVHPLSERAFERASERAVEAVGAPPDAEAVARRSPAVRAVVRELEALASTYGHGFPVAVRGFVVENENESEDDALASLGDRVDADHVVVGDPAAASPPVLPNADRSVTFVVGNPVTGTESRGTVVTGTAAPATEAGVDRPVDR